MPRGTWRSKTQSDALTQTARNDVTRRAEDVLCRRFRPSLERKKQAPKHAFNYAIGVFPQWRGSTFYLCVRYRTPSGRPEDDFVVRSTRLKHLGGGRFELAYLRHTERWQPVYSGLTVKQCFDCIEAEEIFWPVT